jgi:hypothetical protein
MLWIDNFIFNGEEAAFYRVKYLYDTVDIFYICERKYTYQGANKEGLYIDLLSKRFEPYLSKIKFIVDDSQPINPIEDSVNHRNLCASKILADYPDTEFLLTVCNAHEIPDKEVIKCVKGGLYNRCAEGCIYMEMDSFYYNLNWFSERYSGQRMPFIMNDILLKTNKNLHGFRKETEPVFGTFECGWCFSYFMSYADIIRGIESSTHLEFNRSEFKHFKLIMDRIMYGGDIFKRDYVTITKVNDKSKYPKEILELHRAAMKAQFGV